MHGVALFVWKNRFYTRRNRKYRNDAQKSRPHLSGSKRTAFPGAKQRSKSERDALLLAKVSTVRLTKGAR